MTARLPLSPRVRRLVTGPQPVWPRPVDGVAERWARLPPRVRLGVIVALIATVGVGSELRVGSAEARWGGQPVSVLTAEEDLPVGAAAADGVRRTRLPPRAVPDAAVTSVDTDAVLAAPLPRGAVLTSLHVDDRGPAAGLADSLRAVPVPVEAGWGVTAGGWVDVWTDDPAATGPVARSRPVLAVRGDGVRPTALLGLHADEVAAVAGAGADQVRLTHAPPPAAGGDG